MAETRPAICRFCPAHCGVLATIENGRVIRVTGDPENPIYEGYSCVKGRALPEQHSSAARLLCSQVRTAEGRHEPIASTRAMDEIAAKIQSLIDRYGPRSIAMYVGTNTLPYAATPGFAHSWLRGVGTPMFFTSNTIDQPGKQVASALHGGWQAGEQSFASADSWLLVGLNPVISKAAGVPFQNPAQRLKEAAARGMKLVVIDPRRSETARQAWIHLQPRPGEDPVILAGMLAVIIRERLFDVDFVEENITGFEILAEQVRSFTPEYVARRADIPVSRFLEAARAFGTARRGGANCGTGPSFAGHGTLTEYLARCLNAVCGRLARPGDRVEKPNVLLPAYTGKAQPYAPYPAWGYGEKLRVRGLGETTGGLPSAALAEEILLEGDGQVKALICLGGNPMAAWPDQRKTFDALRKLELLVTLDVEMSETARLAHYVIAPKLTLETPGMTEPAERLKYFGPGLGYTKPYAQYAPKLVDPPAGADVIEEWEFFYGLAQRMEIDLQLVNFYGWGRHVESPLEVVPVDMRNKPTTDEILEMLTSGARIPLDEVKRHPHGRIFEEIETIVQPRDPDCDLRLEVGAPTMMQELRQVREEDFEATGSDTRFPYRLIPRRADHVLNSSGRTNPRLADRGRYNPAFMHPDDLAELGLVSGQIVRIASAHDAIPGIVESDDTLRRGLISMTHAFGGTPDDDAKVREIGSNPGRLVCTEHDYDPITGMPRLGAIPVIVMRTAEVGE